MNDNQRFFHITDKILKIQLLRSEILRLTAEFFNAENFLAVDPPILHEQIPNKRHEIYLPYFSNKYSLNSSNALYMGCYAALFKKVYAISPTFRHEQDSINHLVEFRMIETEMIGYDYEMLMCFVEEFVRYILINLRQCATIQNDTCLCERVTRLIESFFPKHVPYLQFVNELQQLENINLDFNTDFSSMDYLISKYISTPIFITEYPFGTWTAKRNSHSNKFLSFNLILPDTYGELCEGCERTNDADFLKYKLQCAGITNLDWYVEAIGNIKEPRAGFGLGFDRLVRWIAGLDKIQDTAIFTR